MLVFCKLLQIAKALAHYAGLRFVKINPPTSTSATRSFCHPKRGNWTLLRPVISALDHILSYAIEQRASDIHFEPKRDATLVRLRIDGVLHEVHLIPRMVYQAIVSRIKLARRRCFLSRTTGIILVTGPTGTTTISEMVRVTGQ